MGNSSSSIHKDPKTKREEQRQLREQKKTKANYESICTKVEKRGISMPLVINKAETKFFAKQNDDPEAWGTEAPDEFEFLESAVVSHKSAPVRTKNRKSSSKKHTSKKLDFDHESSFMATKNTNIDATGMKTTKDLGHSEVLEAVKKGDFETLADCLAAHPKCVDEKDQYHQTALFWVSHTSDLNTVDLLLRYEARVDAANKFGYTPLMRAVRHEQLRMAKHLCSAKANPASHDKFKSVSLHIGAAAGHTDMVSWLLTLAPVLKQVNNRDVDGKTPMHESVRAGHIEITRMIIKSEGTVNCQDCNGRSPLLFALARNDVELAQILIAQHADVDAHDEDGRSVLMHLIKNLMSHPNYRNNTMFGLATALEAKAKVDAADEHGVTALIQAAKGNDPLVCAILTAYGADVHLADDTEKTPMQYARKNAYFEVCRVLADFGGVQAKASKGLTRVLLRSAYYGNVEACKSLLERQANVRAKTRRGKALFEVARSHGQTELINAFSDALEEERQLAAHVGENNKDDDVELERLLKLLGSSSQQAHALQASANRGDAEAVLEAVEEMRKEDLTSVQEVASVTLLLGFLRMRTSSMIKSAWVELRKIRAHTRYLYLQEFVESIREWYKDTKVNAPALQKLLAGCISKVRRVKVGTFESEDERTVQVEAIYDMIFDKTMKRASMAYQLVSDETEASTLFPPDQAPEEEGLDSLQCPKCFCMLGNKQALKEHVKYCQSKLGEEKLRNKIANRQALAHTAWQRLTNAADAYGKEFIMCRADADFLKKMEDERAKRMTETRPVFRGCHDLLDALEDLYVYRQAAAQGATKEAISKFGLDKSLANTGNSNHCAKCMVGMVSRFCIHIDNIPPCLCICNACAFEIGMRLKGGKTATCPACNKKIRSVAVANEEALSALRGT